MDDPQRVGGNERALAEISHPDEDNSGKNGFFVTVNPFCGRKEKQNSNEGSFGNTNAAMDLDTETNVNCAGEMDNKTRKTKVLSDK